MKKMVQRYRQVKTLFRQLPLPVALRILISETVRRSFDPSAVITYAQAGEDRLIEQLLLQFAGCSEPGFYVDVGANDPFVKSNTLRLYLRGWHGLAVDGNPVLMRRYHYYRPRDRVICAVVSNEHREAFFRLAPDPALSHIDSVHADGADSQTTSNGLRVVQTTTLGTLFDECRVPKRFDLLNIDVEGSDLDVLRSFDICAYRPLLVVIEMHGFNLEHAESDPIYRHLVGNDYEMFAYAGRNGFFLDNSPFGPKRIRSRRSESVESSCY